MCHARSTGEVSSSKKRRRFGEYVSDDFDECKKDTLASDLKRLLRDESSMDVTIITIDQQQIKAHKLILSLRSDVFQAMLSNQMSESRTNEIYILDFETSVIEEFVRFLYVDHVPVGVMDSHAAALFEMSRKYEVRGLESLCVKYLIDNMHLNNVMDVLELAEVHDSKGLRFDCLSFIGHYSASLASSDAFMQQLNAYWARAAREQPATIPAVSSGSSMGASTAAAGSSSATTTASSSSSSSSSSSGSSSAASGSSSSAAPPASTALSLLPPESLKGPGVRIARTESTYAGTLNCRLKELLMVMSRVPVHRLPSFQSANVLLSWQPNRDRDCGEHEDRRVDPDNEVHRTRTRSNEPGDYHSLARPERPIRGMRDAVRDRDEYDRSMAYNRDLMGASPPWRSLSPPHHRYSVSPPRTRARRGINATAGHTPPYQFGSTAYGAASSSFPYPAYFPTSPAYSPTSPTYLPPPAPLPFASNPSVP